MSVGPRPIHVGHYVLSGVLGEGAMSTVYLARHRATGRPVALKTLRRAAIGDEEAAARLRLEARVLGKVRAPHLVDALDAGTLDDGTPYLVLEVLDGPPLSVRLGEGPLSIAATFAIADGVLAALESLHAAGFIHRDVKPANVVLHLGRDGWMPKLIDLGVCLDLRHAESAERLTAQGTWVGTPCYMAPEQIDGSRLDVRTDLYGVGALLYECLTGDAPHVGSSAAQVAAAALSEPIVPVMLRRPDCPDALARVVTSSLARARNQRACDARTMREELATIRRQLGLPDAPQALAEGHAPRTPPHDPAELPTERSALSSAWRPFAICVALASSFATGGALAYVSDPQPATSTSGTTSDPDLVQDAASESFDASIEPEPLVVRP